MQETWHCLSKETCQIEAEPPEHTNSRITRLGSFGVGDSLIQSTPATFHNVSPNTTAFWRQSYRKLDASEPLPGAPRTSCHPACTSDKEQAAETTTNPSPDTSPILLHAACKRAAIHSRGSCASQPAGSLARSDPKFDLPPNPLQRVPRQRESKRPRPHHA